MLIAPGTGPQAAEIKVGLGHYTTHLRAGGEREPPAVNPRGVPPAPLRTNQWYSSLYFETWPQPLYAQPGSYRPTSDGFHIDRPQKEVSVAAQRDENDIIAMHRSTLTVQPDFELKGAKAGRASDWAVDVITGDDTDAMTVTVAHGSPYSFHRLTRGDVTLRADAPLQVFERTADGRGVGVIAGGKPFAVYAPGGSRFDAQPDGSLRLVLPQGKRFFTVAVLPSSDAGVLAEFHKRAYAFIVDTRADFVVDDKRSDVTTTFSVKTEVMEGGDSGTLFGLYPHQWHRNPLLKATLPFEYDTIRGTLKLVAGTKFQTRYRYTGVMPFWPGLGEPAAIAQVKQHLEKDTQFGADSLLGNRGTYWEGKGLNRALQVMNIAEQQGDRARRDAILAAMKKRLELWFKPEPDAERYFHYHQRTGHADRLSRRVRLGAGSQRPPLPLRLLDRRRGADRAARSGVGRDATSGAPWWICWSPTSRPPTAATRCSRGFATSTRTKATRGRPAWRSSTTATTRSRRPRRSMPGRR